MNGGWPMFADTSPRRRHRRPAGAMLILLLLPCAARAASEREAEVPLALDGYCPVVLAEECRWARGDWRHTVMFEDQRYYFTNAEQRRKFLQQAVGTLVAGAAILAIGWFFGNSVFRGEAGWIDIGFDGLGIYFIGVGTYDFIATLRS